MLSKKTASLWSYLNRPEILQDYLNPLYEPNNRVIWPTVAPVSLVSFEVCNMFIIFISNSGKFNKQTLNRKLCYQGPSVIPAAVNLHRNWIAILQN